MQFALRLLLTLSLVWCGLHLAEPAEARGAHGAEASMVELLEADCGEDRADPERAEHLHHHHCPLAADPNVGADRSQRFARAALLFAHPTPALGSLTRAPPLQPPSA